MLAKMLQRQVPAGVRQRGMNYFHHRRVVGVVDEGRTLSADMKDSFAARGIDPCGENGEYHTAVVDSPLFSHPIRVSQGVQVRRGDCVALDLIPDARRG